MHGEKRMIDLTNIGKYQENNRIEAKRALGGLPESLWETYSAFANTLGGILLLGVEEGKDKSLRPIRLPEPEALVQEFWKILNDPARVSANILTDRDVRIERSEDACFIAITVPRADRRNRPIYLDRNPRNSYRRNGEGDYRCSPEEIAAMQRDASARSEDRRVLTALGADALNGDSIRCYRRRLKESKPGWMGEALPETDFLLQMGALGRGEDGALHPTAAGLLMFGREGEIVREYPAYALRLLEDTGKGRDAVSADCGGNLFDFFLRVCGKMAELRLPDGRPVSADGAVYGALCEALANCLINADYHGKRETAVRLGEDGVSMENPGTFRVRPSEAREGGISDPRHETLLSLFHQIGVGRQTGSGLPGIFSVWHARGWAEPVITERFSPEGITLVLRFGASQTEALSVRGESSEQTAVSAVQTEASAANPEKFARSRIFYRRAVIACLTEQVSATSAELSAELGISPAEAEQILSELVQAELVVSDGAETNAIYQLRSSPFSLEKEKGDKRNL